MAWDILGKSFLVGVDWSWDADGEEQVEHKGASATNAEADAAAPIVAAAAVATNGFIFHSSSYVALRSCVGTRSTLWE